MNLGCFVPGIMMIKFGNTELEMGTGTSLWMTRSLSSVPANRNVVCNVKEYIILTKFILHFKKIRFISLFLYFIQNQTLI